MQHLKDDDIYNALLQEHRKLKEERQSKKPFYSLKQFKIACTTCACIVVSLVVALCVVFIDPQETPNIPCSAAENRLVLPGFAQSIAVARLFHGQKTKPYMCQSLIFHFFQSDLLIKSGKRLLILYICFPIHSSAYWRIQRKIITHSIISLD